MIDPRIVDEVFTQDVYRAGDRLAGARVLDVGANAGIFALFARSRGAARVVCVEPGPGAETCEALGFEVRRVAVGPAPGRARWEATDAHANGVVVPDEAGTVEVVTLAELLRTDGPFDVVKLDVEGAEFDALCACPHELLARVGFLTLEFHLGPLGALVEHLSETHSVTTLGARSRGGYLYAYAY